MEWNNAAASDLPILDEAPESSSLMIDLNNMSCSVEGPKRIVKEFISFTNWYKGYGNSGITQGQQLNNKMLEDTIRTVVQDTGEFDYRKERIIVTITKDFTCKTKECKFGIIKKNNQLYKCKCMGVKVWKKNKSSRSK